uniref:Glycosyltransferase 2-like domain-containing protein n=1 Tax=viral metagenome TaxID=1070528 RepID=A0A6C0BPN3_9ZZZZ
MNKTIVMYSVLLIVIFIVIAKISCLSYEHFNTHDYIDIFCLMVTGKNNERINYAKVSIDNFLKQTYKNKHLIIVNESNISCLNNREYSNIVELHVPKTLTLGAKRNMALKLVPKNCIWTTWDDDDWRSDDYLHTLFVKLSSQPNKEILVYSNRLEHNLNTNFTWKISIPTGTYIFFGFQKNYIEYENINNKEDSIVKRYILTNPQKIVLFNNNNPKMYVRFIHKSNTSVYVDYKKKSIRKENNINSPVHEFEATKKEIEYVNRIKKMYE